MYTLMPVCTPSRAFHRVRCADASCSRRLSRRALQKAGLHAGSSDVYLHEMPGGQYTNLKFQATSLGLAEAWDDVKVAYATANRLLGNIPKVTPSSKVVGDLAQFIVSSGKTEQEIVDEAEQLSFPSSVVDYMQGMLGQPPGGFPEPLRSRILGNKPRVEGRPGHSLPPANLESLREKLVYQHGEPDLHMRDVVSAAMYPEVYDEYCKWKQEFNDAGVLPTRAFVAALEQDEEVEVQISKGQKLFIKYKAKGELLEGSERDLFFELDGVPRVVRVVDRTTTKSHSAAATKATEKAEPSVLGSVGAPLSGECIKVNVKPGQAVAAGDELIVLSAMKMETAVQSPCEGVIRHVGPVAGDQVASGDLLVFVDEGADDASEGE